MRRPGHATRDAEEDLGAPALHGGERSDPGLPDAGAWAQVPSSETFRWWPGHLAMQFHREPPEKRLVDMNFAPKLCPPEAP